MPGDSLKVNINGGATNRNSYDAIVIGSGISGGWAAKELCDLGLKTLVLERDVILHTSKIIQLPQKIPGSSRIAAK